MEVQQFDSLSKIDAAEWDHLAADDVLYSHAWLSVVEMCPFEKADFFYLLVRESGKLLGAAACRIHLRDDSASLDTSFYGRVSGLARAVGLGAAPAIVVGSRFGFSPPFLLDPALSDSHAEEIAQALVRRLVERAEVLKASVMVRNARRETVAWALSREGFLPTPELPTTYIDIRWNTFAEFIRDLRNVHRATVKGIRHQISRAKREGIVIERITDPALVSAEVYEVLEQHHRRLNGVPLPFSRSLLPEAVRKLGDDAELIVARDGSHVLGVMFGLRRGGVCHAILVGTATERARTTDTYFLMLDHMMARAIESADRRLYYGRLVYAVKMRRGCSIEDSMLWIRGRSKLHRAGLKRITPIRNIRVTRMIRALEPVSRSNAAALQGR